MQRLSEPSTPWDNVLANVTTITLHGLSILARHRVFISAEYARMQLLAARIDEWLSALDATPTSEWQVCTPTFGGAWHAWDMEAGLQAETEDMELMH